MVDSRTHNDFMGHEPKMGCIPLDGLVAAGADVPDSALEGCNLPDLALGRNKDVSNSLFNVVVPEGGYRITKNISRFVSDCFQRVRSWNL